MSWFSQNKTECIASVHRLMHTPFSSLMSISVVAITLSLPTIMQLMVGNAERLGQSWEGRPQLSVFLAPGTTEARGLELTLELQAKPEITQVEFVSADQAMEEFKMLSGLGSAIELLPENPLPASLLILPDSNFDSAEATTQLQAQLRQIPEAEEVQLDLEWIQRFNSMLDIVESGAQVISILLALAVILTVSNMIRLAIINRKEEIEIIKLIGGSDAFVRRPFLYQGFQIGLAGALLASLITYAVLLWMNGPIGRLASLYGSDFGVQGLSAQGLSWLILAGGGLGLLASVLSVSQHLRDIEPR
ncbi:MAG: permease-like cell division protein FtsX [Arenicellaceae bacterium]|nr:permease-like cell division protein FtsX [Arenicellaceae bacterium]